MLTGKETIRCKGCNKEVRKKTPNHEYCADFCKRAFHKRKKKYEMAKTTFQDAV